MSAAPESSRAELEVHNPATGELIERLPVDSREEVFAKVQRVREAQKRWARQAIEDRAAQVGRLREVLVRRADEIANTVAKENGKVRQEAFLHDIGPVLAVLEYFAHEAPRILAPKRLHLALLKHKKSYLVYQPKGVVAVISPWNFPFFIPAADTVMALIAGNGVVIKPSENTPRAGLLVKSCLDEAGIDPELVQVVLGFGETGAALIDAQPDHVVFTGSVPTGRRIGVACAERFIPCTLELGGKAPAVVLDDADLERTAHAILWGGFANAGQVCASVERVYATAATHDRLVARVAEMARGLEMGSSPGDGPKDIGAMTFPRQVEIVRRLVEDAREKGAQVLAGGTEPEGGGRYLAPTVLAGCNHDMKVMKEEIFGPVVPFMKVNDVEEAIRLANDSLLGLGAYVFGGNLDNARRVAERIEAGSVMINDVLLHAGLPEMPWGGIKQSGHGVARSDRALEDLCHARHVCEPRVQSPNLSREPHWFPYSEKSERQVLGFIKDFFGSSAPARLARWLLS